MALSVTLYSLEEKMKQALSYTLWVLFTFGCVTFSHAVGENERLLFGQDDREYVGRQQPLSPWAAIGVLKMKSVTCTATLIRENTVLTAAHCFWQKGKLNPPQSFIAGETPSSSGATYQVLDYAFPKSFPQGLAYRGEDLYISKKVAHLDIAILKVQLISGQAPRPFPLFQGDLRELKRALKRAKWQVNQAGYSDEKNVLKMHARCRVTGILKNLTLSHQCDTLAGDSGSPLWIDVNGEPKLIAIQSSAPDVKDRELADNVAISILTGNGLIN